MISDTSFDITIDVPNPIRFIVNKEANIKKHIIDKYVGNCYMSSRIIEFKDILKMSDCYLVTSNNEGHCVINVCFSCTVQTYHENMIVPSMTIVIENGCTMAKSDGITVAINSQDIHKLLSNNMVVPIKLTGVQRYQTGSPMVVSSGKVFTCDVEEVFYRIDGQISIAECNNMVDILQKIEKISIDKTHFLYPLYSEFKTVKSSVKSIAIKELLEPNKPLNMIIFKSTSTPKDVAVLSIAEDAEVVIDATPAAALTTILLEILDFKKTMAEMTSIYKKKEDHQSLIEMLSSLRR